MDQNVFVYRGTRRQTLGGIHKGASFAYSLPVAIIWSALPGDGWAQRKTQFLSTSTVHIAQIATRNPLVLFNSCALSLGDILRTLHWPDGITNDEVRRIYNYMHNRIIGATKGGDFSYIYLDEDGEETDDDEVPLSFRHPQSLISYYAREDWDSDPSIAAANRLVADAYIFVDAPAVQRAALAAGHDVIIYRDVFAGGGSAAEDLFGITDVLELDGVTEDSDLKYDTVPTHMTLRLLDEKSMIKVESVPVDEALRLAALQRI